MAKPEFVYFDLGKVILDFSHETACEKIAAISGVSVSVVRKVIFDDDLQVRYETGLISSGQFHQEFCGATHSNPAIDELLLAYSDIFELNQPIVPIIAGLFSARIRIGLLSNTCAAHWAFVNKRYPSLKDFFSVTILSYQANSMKPDREIYEQAIKNSSVVAKQIFFVDDKPENVQGAIEAGMDAVVYRSAPELANQLQSRGVKFNC